jgi:NhaP-type Na+/H+ or K+/H+ antiporter
MALSIPEGFPQRAVIQDVTFGIVLFTLLVQGTTISRVVNRFVTPGKVLPSASATPEEAAPVA